MCFGGSKNTGKTETNKTTEMPAWLQDAAKANLADMTSLKNSGGYQKYGGPMVAGLSGDETNAFSMMGALAGNDNPYLGEAQGAFSNAATAGPSSVSTVRAIDNVPGAPGTAGGSTADYMNPYLEQALAPQLREIERQRSDAGNRLNAQSTAAGAFGDARSAFESAETNRNINQARSDTVGQGYNQAFDRAMSLKTGDINRNLDVGKTNAALKEQGMQRALAGGTALQGLSGHKADLAQLLAKAGGIQRGVTQAGFDASRGEHNKQQQSIMDLFKMLSGTITGLGSSNNTSQGTETRSAPDNSGFGMLGSLLGTGMQMLPMLSDRRYKENLVRLGALSDGLSVYRFNYIGETESTIGLMAQDVQKHYPEAVVEIDGKLHVLYSRVLWHNGIPGVLQ